MSVTSRDLLRDESGLTLVELLVSITTGLVVMAAIASAMVMTIRETGRVTSHVESNQRSRLAMTKIVNQLHSACFAPQIAPVRAESNGSVLTFVHQVGSQVAPVPILSRIALEGETLSQTNYSALAGTGPNWKFATANPSTPEALMTGVKPISEGSPVFSYYTYANGEISGTPLPTPLRTDAEAARAIQVRIAFQTVPAPPVQGDEGAETQIQDAVLFRLSAPAYNVAAGNAPCQ